jgi:uncharacterized protein YlzI (FlbEa/FlbD family)
MKKLYSPNNDSELALIKSILDGEGIQYFVHNDHFGTLKVGPRIELLNAKTIMVAEKHYEVSKGIIDDFLKNIQEASENTKPKYSIRDKIRMVIEAILFTWFIPGNRWNKRKPKQNNKSLENNVNR